MAEAKEKTTIRPGLHVLRDKLTVQKQLLRDYVESSNFLRSHEPASHGIDIDPQRRRDVPTLASLKLFPCV
jgi:hypothetical protein